MECSESRLSDEKKAREALERMSDEALALIIGIMEETAKKSPRALTIVKSAPAESGKT